VIMYAIDPQQIYGEVYYMENGWVFPVAGAEIKIDGVFVCFTNDTGSFVLDYDEGDIDLIVEHTDFETYHYTGKVPSGVWRLELIPL
jgi:hypothetical protein